MMLVTSMCGPMRPPCSGGENLRPKVEAGAVAPYAADTEFRE